MPAASGRWRAIMSVLAPVVVGVVLAYGWTAADARMAAFRPAEAVRHHVSGQIVSHNKVTATVVAGTDSGTAAAEATGYSPVPPPVSTSSARSAAVSTTGRPHGRHYGRPGRHAVKHAPRPDPTISWEGPVPPALRDRAAGRHDKPGVPGVPRTSDRGRSVRLSYRK
jgi:hypothetical protein